MCRINDAYQTIVEHVAASAPDSDVPPKRRLSPEEIDALSRAIGSDGPVDWALGAIGWVGSAIEALVGMVCVIALGVRLLTDLPRGDFSLFREYPELVLLALLLAVLFTREVLRRIRVTDPASREPEP